MSLSKFRTKKFRENIALILLFTLFFRAGLGYAHDLNQNSLQFVTNGSETSLSEYCGLIKSSQIDSDRTIGFCPVCHALHLSGDSVQSADSTGFQSTPIYSSVFFVVDRDVVFERSELVVSNRARAPPYILVG